LEESHLPFIDVRWIQIWIMAVAPYSVDIKWLLRYAKSMNIFLLENLPGRRWMNKNWKRWKNWISEGDRKCTNENRRNNSGNRPSPYIIRFTQFQCHFTISWFENWSAHSMASRSTRSSQFSRWLEQFMCKTSVPENVSEANLTGEISVIFISGELSEVDILCIFPHFCPLDQISDICTLKTCIYSIYLACKRIACQRSVYGIYSFLIPSTAQVLYVSR